MKNPRLFVTIWRLFGIVLVIGLTYWGAAAIQQDGLSYWVKYIAQLAGMLLAFYICLFILIKLYKLLFDWRNPDYNRELSQNEISYIDSQMKELSAYVDSRNFSSKKYWLVAWVMFGLFFFIGMLIFALIFYLFEEWLSMPDHPELGKLLDFEETGWTSIPLIFTSITAGVLFAYFLSAMFSYVYRPFKEAITISLTWEESSLGEKAKTVPDVVAKYIRVRLLDTNDVMSGDELLSFVGRQRRLSLLKWAIGFAIISILLAVMNSNVGTRFYERGMTQYSLLSVDEKIEYQNLDFIGLACLYDNEERETAQQFYYFFKDEGKLGRIRFPVVYDKDFDQIIDHVLSYGVEMKRLNYTFNRPSKNVESPYEHCAEKLIEKNPTEEDWIKKVLRLDAFVETKQ